MAKIKDSLNIADVISYPTQTEIEKSNGRILVSYETPAAFVDIHGNAFEITKDATFRNGKKVRSRTTSKHIKAWLDGKTATQASLSFMESLV